MSYHWRQFQNISIKFDRGLVGDVYTDDEGLDHFHCEGEFPVSTLEMWTGDLKIQVVYNHQGHSAYESDETHRPFWELRVFVGKLELVYTQHTEEIKDLVRDVIMNTASFYNHNEIPY